MIDLIKEAVLGLLNGIGLGACVVTPMFIVKRLVLGKW